MRAVLQRAYPIPTASLLDRIGKKSLREPERSQVGRLDGRRSPEGLAGSPPGFQPDGQFVDDFAADPSICGPAIPLWGFGSIRGSPPATKIAA